MMKHAILLVLIFMTACIGSKSSCNKNDEPVNTENNSVMAKTKIKITVNAQTFTATLLANDSAESFRKMLPMTIPMTELNGNEKYYDLTKSLPTSPANPGTIKNGDLMLYGSKTLVVFYKTFSTAYSYTQLGSVDDVAGFAAALGSGNATVVLEVE